MTKILTAALAALLLATPIAASAQDAPPYGDAPAQNQEVAQDVPSYAQVPAQDEQIRGRIVSFDGAYSLQVRDERGFVDNVQLHPGTIINPTGLTLAPGMIVSILGYNSGNYFAANEVDTPYTFDSGVPYYNGHPWDYYGPSISLGFFFGNVGWWHGGYFHGPYVYNGGARYYNNVNVNTIYRGGSYYHGGGYHGGGAPNPAPPYPPHPVNPQPPGNPTHPVNPEPPGYHGSPPTHTSPGTYHGRDYVAPPEHGGYYHSAAPVSHGGGSPGGSHSSGGGGGQHHSR